MAMNLKQTQTTEVSIGDYMFYLRPFPAFKAANISGDIASMIVPLLGGLAPLLTSNGNMSDEDALPMLATAFNNLTGDQVEKLMKKLLIDNNNISVEGEITNGKVRPFNMDLANEIFCGSVWDMYMLCWEVLKLNYSGFFEKLQGTQFGNLLGSTETNPK